MIRSRYGWWVITAEHSEGEDTTSGPRWVVDRSYRGIAGVTSYQHLDEDGQPSAGPTLVLIGHMHGNESVGRQVIEHFDPRHQLLARGRIITILANLEAMALDRRHTPEGVDMNRLWHRASLERLGRDPASRRCYEEHRVVELAPVMCEGDVILDMHSTSRPSKTHLIFRDDYQHAEVAARLGVSRLVTGIHTGRILDGGLAADVGLRRGEKGERLGFTLEAGQHTNPKNFEAAWDVVARLLQHLDMWGGPKLPPVSGEYEVYEVIDRFVQAAAHGEKYRFVGYVGGETGGGRRHDQQRLLESFESIEADEILLRRGTTECVRAHGPFTMLMPAPTAEVGDDLFYYTKRRHAALHARPKTDADARIEAEAVERFIDLMEDDEAHRGVTMASFKPRLTLDMCAAMIRRTARLPVGHPHRRILVIGRGDWGGDEHELRDGQRYQQAMHDAISEGIPVDRIQLLRGASFGWLKHLTTSSFTDREGRPTMRLFVSARQAHTVSVLAVGDLERALREGDYHHVRVALVVEAATVEPEGPQVLTRIARAAIYGARPEVLRVALAFSRGLKAEHRRLLAGSRLAVAAEGIAADDGALVPRDEAELSRVQRALYHLQHDAWREALRHEVTRPVELPDDEALGMWLSRVVVTSGVFDSEGLRRLLVRSEEGRHTVDPTALDRIAEFETLCVADPPEGGRVVLDASAVDRDTYERWVGWKRFIREAQQLPGDRGRDMDFVSSAEAIRRRFARWCSEACDLARRSAGRWLLVVAGDGLNPRRELGEDGWEVIRNHRAAVMDPNLHYLRIQHAQATHLPWYRGFVEAMGRRPPGGASISVGWEAEHGGAINVVLLARATGDATVHLGSLDGWRAERAAVVVSELEGVSSNEYQLALFTEPNVAGDVNQELLHFGRAHCSGLLGQAQGWVSGRPGPSLTVRAGQSAQLLIARWIHRVRVDGSGDAEASWAAGRRLGLGDPSLLERVVEAALGDEDPARAAWRIWDSAAIWPPLAEGPWSSLRMLDTGTLAEGPTAPGG